MLISYKFKNLKHFVTNKCTYRPQKALGNQKRHYATVLREAGAYIYKRETKASELKKPLC